MSAAEPPPAVVLPLPPDSTPGRTGGPETCNLQREVCCEPITRRRAAGGCLRTEASEPVSQPLPKQRVLHREGLRRAGGQFEPVLLLGSSLGEGDITHVACGTTCQAGVACLPGPPVPMVELASRKTPVSRTSAISTVSSGCSHVPSSSACTHLRQQALQARRTVLLELREQDGVLR